MVERRQPRRVTYERCLGDLRNRDRTGCGRIEVDQLLDGLGELRFGGRTRDHEAWSRYLDTFLRQFHEVGCLRLGESLIDRGACRQDEPLQ